MDVTSATPTAAPAVAAKPQDAGRLLSSDFETFLKMLTTQMQNQDPLNPLESTDFAVQLATFSGVEQQVRSNDLLAGLAAEMGIMGMSQLAGWVGMEARAPAPAHFSGGPVSVATEPASAAQQAVLVVRDAAGSEVSRQAIPVAGGTVPWTGTNQNGAMLPHGSYSFEVESYAFGDFLSVSPADTYALIAEARLIDGQTVLIMDGGIEVPASDVRALRAPGNPA